MSSVVADTVTGGGDGTKAILSGGFHVPVSNNATSDWRLNETPCLNKEFHFTVS
jgi:hypothetical protein